jgi:broad specificity phosphatase PhoE
VLAVVRHGETVSYRDGGLTPAGYAQAAAAGRRLLLLARACGTAIGPDVCTSPSRRCRETARVIAGVLTAEGLAARVVVTDAIASVRLVEDGQLLDLGLAQDRPPSPAVDDLSRFWSELATGHDVFRSWEEGGFPWFESPPDVRARLRAFIEGHDGPTVAVTHGEICRLLVGEAGIPELGAVLAWDGPPRGARRLAGMMDPGVGRG